MGVKILPAIEGGQVACLCCGPTESQICMDARIAVGFGSASLTKDGEPVWSEQPGMEYEDCMTVSQAEEIATENPDHDWRIALHGPLRGRVYQRHGEAKWMLVETDQGFA